MLCALTSAGALARLGGGGLVSPNGRVAALHIDRASRAAVIAFAGEPQAEEHGNQDGAPWDALGYGCGALGQTPIVDGRSCKTVFYVNEATGRLATFATRSRHYHSKRGIRVGMGSGTVERELHMQLVSGCEQNFYLNGRTAWMTIATTGGHEVGGHRHVVGAHVWALVLHSRRNDVGVFDCL